MLLHQRLLLWVDTIITDVVLLVDGTDHFEELGMVLHYFVKIGAVGRFGTPMQTIPLLCL